MAIPKYDGMEVMGLRLNSEKVCEGAFNISYDV